jgi:signal transduction histidine kinase
MRAAERSAKRRSGVVMAVMQRPRALWLGAIVGGTSLLVFLAVRGGTAAPDPSLPLIALDAVVGLAFVAAATVSPGAIVERVLVLSIGVTWLVGSIEPAAGSIHQAVLAVALVAFPSGRIRGITPVVLAAAAVSVAFRLLPQLAVASLYAVVAGRAFGTGRSRLGARTYPAVAAAGVAAALALSWLTNRYDLEALDPTLALVLYELVLLLIAGAFPVAARAVVRSRERLADEIVSDMTLEGLEGITNALRSILGDPSLRIYRWDTHVSSYVDDWGRQVDEGVDGRVWLSVHGAGGRIAALAHRSSKLDDAHTASAVASAVRLAVTNLRLREDLNERLLELEASRARILAASDRARSRAAAELRDEVETSLELALSELSSVDVTDQEAEDALRIGVDELETTSAAIADLVMGVAPAELGDGRLRHALAQLVDRSPVPISLTVDDDAQAAAGVETTLYYVISEALANAIKHAAAAHIVVRVKRVDAAIVATISDDGRGGADPAGSGLQGLEDRLAVNAGRLRVESPSGAGTTVVATIPG